MHIEKTLIDQSIDIVVQAVTAGFGMFKSLLDSVDAVGFWISAVLLVMVFSILILPLRGGQMVHVGGFAGFVSNKISGKRRHHNKTDSSD